MDDISQLQLHAATQTWRCMAAVGRSRLGGQRRMGCGEQKLRRCGDKLPRGVHYRVIALTDHRPVLLQWPTSECGGGGGAKRRERGTIWPFPCTLSSIFKAVKRTIGMAVFRQGDRQQRTAMCVASQMLFSTCNRMFHHRHCHCHCRSFILFLLTYWPAIIITITITTTNTTTVISSSTTTIIIIIIIILL